MKRIICIVLTAALCLGVLAGCGARGTAKEGHALAGTWTATEASAARGFDNQMTFETNGTFRGQRTLDGAVTESSGTYQVDDDRTLTMTYTFDGREIEDVFTYSEEAKDCNGSFWYIDGDTLYIGEAELRRN